MDFKEEEHIHEEEGFHTEDFHEEVEEDSIPFAPPSIFSRATQAAIDEAIEDLFYEVIGNELRELVSPPKEFEIILKGVNTVATLTRYKESDPIGIVITSFGAAE